MTDADVKSSSEDTCYCGMWPREEYGAHCPSCAGVVPDSERQYWLRAVDAEWLRQHVPVAQWPQGFLEYWLGLRIEGHQPYGEQLYAPGGAWGTGAPSRAELAGEPSWADRTDDPLAATRAAHTCPDCSGLRQQDGAETEHPACAGCGQTDGHDLGCPTALGGTDREPVPPPGEPGPHPRSLGAVGQALRDEELEVFVDEASGKGIAPEEAATAWTLLEEVTDRVAALARRWADHLERSDVRTLAGADPDAYRTVAEVLRLAELGMDYLTRER